MQARSKIFAIPILVFVLLITGCGDEKEKRAEKVIPVLELIKTPGPAYEGGDYFVYGLGDPAALSGFAPAGSQEMLVLNYVDCKSGDIVRTYSYTAGTYLLSSPDLSMHVVLLRDRIRGYVVYLYDSETEELIWQTAIDDPGKQWIVRPQANYWDFESGRLVLGFEGNITTGDIEDASSILVKRSWYYVVIDLGTGDWEGTVHLISPEASPGTRPGSIAVSAYARGKLFTILPQFPAMEFSALEAMTGPYGLDIYSIDPILKKAIPLENPGILPLPPFAPIFARSDGKVLFVQGEDFFDDGTPKQIGGTIWVVDTEHASWDKLLSATDEEAFFIHGVSDNGGILCYTHSEKAPEGAMVRHFIMDVADGSHSQLPIDSSLVMIWLSHSGRYVSVVDYENTDVIRIIDTKTNESIEIQPPEGYDSFTPFGFPGSW